MSLAAIGLVVAAGCTGQRKTETVSGSAPVLGAADAASLVSRHNRRVELLERVFSNGVAEFRWVDGDGKEHFEPQVNVKLWLSLPRTSALRAEKLGEVLLWLGSDARQYWVFDLTGEETSLYLGRHESSGWSEGASPLLIRPLALLDLAGLSRLGEPSAGDGTDMAWDGQRRAWAMVGEGVGGPMVVYLDEVRGLPVRVETLARDGRVVLAADLERYASVPVRGRSSAAYPPIPTLIDIADPEGGVRVKIALDEPDGMADEQPWDRVFDLQRLMGALRPDRIEEEPVE